MCHTSLIRKKHLYTKWCTLIFISESVKFKQQNDFWLITSISTTIIMFYEVSAYICKMINPILLLHVTLKYFYTIFFFRSTIYFCTGTLMWTVDYNKGVLRTLMSSFITYDGPINICSFITYNGPHKSSFITYDDLNKSFLLLMMDLIRVFLLLMMDLKRIFQHITKHDHNTKNIISKSVCNNKWLSSTIRKFWPIQEFILHKNSLRPEPPYIVNTASVEAF